MSATANIPTEVEVVVIREGDQFTAQCLNFDVASCGDSPEEALAMVKEAVQLFLEGMSEAEINAARTVAHRTVLVDRA